MNAVALTAYQARFTRVLDHIDGHLDGDLSLDSLCAVAAFSKFHFHRQFAALFGISLHRYVQLKRLNRAAWQLAFRQASVTDAALDAGYDGPEAFARAFKAQTGQSPSAFRKQADWKPWHISYAPVSQARSHLMSKDNHIVAIRHFPETRVAMMRHAGDPKRIPETVRRFIDWRKANGLPPRLSATFNLMHDDPDNTPAQDYRMDLCAATDHDIAPNDAGVTAGVIPAGRVAVVRHTGSYDRLGDTASWFYREWLPASGEDMRDFPPYLQRVSFFPDVPETEAVTDIFLPLKG